jgi:DNA repair protein RadA/Sms
MAKDKIQFVCTDCGANHLKWMGQCSECGTWNTLKEFREAPLKQSISQQQPSISVGITAFKPVVQNIKDIKESDQVRLKTQLNEFDRTLGGGLVEGSVLLLGGDPGIGKSTLILQILANLSKTQLVLYVSGEESAHQISQRAKRLSINESLPILIETNVENILLTTDEIKPKVMVIDSIQTMVTELSTSAAGSVSQVRECAQQLTNYAKRTNTILFLIGHVTKEGALAGPRILEHMVDTVLYFEGDAAGRYRLIRAVKNRFGAVNELSVFAMTPKGLKQIENPSAIFLSNEKPAPGSVVTVIREGTKPLLLEIQALVDQTSGQFKRVSVGLEQNRLAMQLAILHKHGGIVTADQDVFINVVGGIKTNDTAVDLAVMLAIISSFANKIIDKEMVVFGEVGLTGEIRPVYNGEERIIEAAKHGFKTAIVPKANKPKKEIKGLKVIGVETLDEVLELSNIF